MADINIDDCATFALVVFAYEEDGASVLDPSDEGCVRIFTNRDKAVEQAPKVLAAKVGALEGCFGMSVRVTVCGVPEGGTAATYTDRALMPEGVVIFDEEVTVEDDEDDDDEDEDSDEDEY